ncbi:MAG: acetoacetate--CoA ligase [Thermoplasmatales archaeon]
MSQRPILWEPGDICRSSNLEKYRKWVNTTFSTDIKNYEELWKWSVDNIEKFWESLIFYFQIIREGSYNQILNSRAMPGNRWFSGLLLNYAENAINLGNQGTLIISVNESGSRSEILRTEFLRSVGSIQSFLRDVGVAKGDRVASMLPNIPETMEALYATAATGAIWSSSSPDFGSEAIIERFKQIGPKVLFVKNEYVYNGRLYQKGETIGRVVESLPSLKAVVVVGGVEKYGGNTWRWNEISNGSKQPDFVRVDFNDPLWVLYSSGTTGPPKPIVHSHGGILLEHLKLLSIHYNMSKGDKFFWYTTTGWMMWNVLVSSIATGATAVLYDGSPTFPDGYSLWKMAESEGISFFGTSAAYLSAIMKEKIVPNGKVSLEKLSAIGSTGSPLSPECFKYVYENVKNNVWLASISGGTDLCTAFLGGCVCEPVREGELQCRNLGADIHALDEKGAELINEVGELVIEKPMPSMPIFLWNDDGTKLYETYYSKYPGMWRHGDWVIITEHGSAVILGRSDSTLKRRGIRIGTAEIYNVLDKIHEVKDSIIVGVELPGGDYYMPLFVVTDEDNFDFLKQKIFKVIKEELSARHLPDEIIRVSKIPKTINGKKMEVPLKKLFMGFPPDKIFNAGSMEDPGTIREFMPIAERIRKEKGLSQL